MPYPEAEEITCRCCGHEILIPPVTMDEKYICPNCNHVIRIVIQIVDEGYNRPDPRFIC